MLPLEQAKVQRKYFPNAIDAINPFQIFSSTIALLEIDWQYFAIVDEWLLSVATVSLL